MSTLTKVEHLTRYIIIAIVIFIVSFLVYRMLNTSIEVYTYTTEELHKNSTIVTHENDKVYTNYIYSSIYKNDKITKGGYIYSINNHLSVNDSNHVMGTVTYKTEKGTITGLIYYTTGVNELYLYGKIADVRVDNDSGYYAGRDNIIHIVGKDDGVREVTIVSKPKFWLFH